MTRKIRALPLLLISAGALLLSATGGAVAAGMITGANIQDGTVSSADLKDGTVTSTDVKNDSLRLADLTPAAREGVVGPQGPAGVDGADGAPGTDGADGAPGPSTAYRTSPTDVTLPSGGSSHTLASLSLPAGAYTVGATFQLSNDNEAAQPVLCQIIVGTESAGPYAAILEPNFSGHFTNIPVTLTHAAELAVDSVASVSCYDNAGPDTGEAEARRIHLWAIKVGELVTQ